MAPFKDSTSKAAGYVLRCRRGFGASSWSSVAAGSYIAKIEAYNHGGIVHTPADIFFNNYNLRGASYPGLKQDCLIVTCCDDLQFGQGHLGFTDRHCCNIAPTANANENIQELGFSGTYFDGGLGGADASGRLFRIGGTAGRIVK